MKTVYVVRGSHLFAGDITSVIDAEGVDEATLRERLGNEWFINFSVHTADIETMDEFLEYIAE